MSLRALSPIDGRYADKVAPLRDWLSEFALIKFRAVVELRWLRAMSAEAAITHVRAFTPAELALLDALEADFDLAAAERVKAIETRVNHDVKAVEYYLRERLEATSLADMAGSLHFACTSDDINNLACALMLRGAVQSLWQPNARALLDSLYKLAHENADIPMLSRTHGQAATPTTVGKELAVFAHRLRRQLRQVETQEYPGKFNGAVGAYNAHVAAYPNVDWQAVSRRFVGSLGLARNPLTTQIEPHDWIAELAHSLARFNTVTLDLCRDMWLYISLGYFRQQVAAGETGSSTMPHKVNPIDFENAEANLGVSNALLTHLAEKLPVSRLQRDLSDSSALRNVGVAIGHSYLAISSARRGLGKVSADRERLAADLDGEWQLLAEAAQTVMRKHHLPDAYEQLKDLTRGQAITRETLHEFIESLALPGDEKERLLELTPATYIGLAPLLARQKLDTEDTEANPT